MGKGNCKTKKSSKNSPTIKPFHLFLSGSAGVGKSHLVKKIHLAVSKLLRYHGTSREKPRVWILAPAGVTSINVSRTTIHSVLNLKCHGKLYPLDANTLATLRNRFSEVQLIIIDGISVVARKVICQIHKRLIEIFKLPDQAFAGKSILGVGDLYQLPPVNAKPVYAYTLDFTQTMGYLSTDLWRLFKLAELTDVMRQTDKDFIKMLNKIRKGLVDESRKKMLRLRFVNRTIQIIRSMDYMYLQKMHQYHLTIWNYRMSSQIMKLKFIPLIPFRQVVKYHSPK